MIRINWADPSLSGGLFEKIVGCLLGIEHPEAVRVLPSQGDGGVDIFVPVGDQIIDVYQAKHYPSRLHWTKIQESLGKLSGGTWQGRTIRNWFLTVPQQPTPENVRKLDEAARGVPFETRWFGEDKLVALAARHPEVGDYYLGDGRAQLERLARDWDTCLSRVADGQSPRIEDVQNRLAGIAAALGRTDPHLEYGVDVHPSRHHHGPLARPATIALSSREVDGYVVTCHAYPRYRGALEDAEDRLRSRLELTTEAARRVVESLAVGSAVDLAPADIVGYEAPRVGHQPEAGMDVSARLRPWVDRMARAVSSGPIYRCELAPPA